MLFWFSLNNYDIYHKNAETIFLEEILSQHFCDIRLILNLFLLSGGRSEVDLVARRQTHDGVARIIKINSLDIEEAGRARAGRVVLLHSVVSAPDLGAVGRGEE